MNNSEDPGSICSQHTERITVAGIPVSVVRQGIKMLQVAVTPPEGQVRVAAPLHTSDEAVQRAVMERLSWIREQQAACARQIADTAEPKLVSGEQHWLLGNSYPLQVVEQAAAPGSITLLPGGANDPGQLRLLVSASSSREERQEVLEQWYQDELTKLLPALLQRWQALIGDRPIDCGVKPMATRWGSCNPRSRRIWLNRALVHKSTGCLEYILVHELVHLRERRHGPRFDALLDDLLPDWRTRRTTLAQPPLARPDWGY